MPDRTPTPTPTPVRRGAAAVRLAAGLAALGCVAATGFWFARQRPPAPGRDADPVVAVSGGKPAAPGGAAPFAAWPAEKPEVVLVLTGQTYGYLSPCGCSKPQRGGLERRANFIETLKAKGWPVVGLDLGDVAPGKGLAEQNRLKYRTAMTAMAALGYAAVGLGEYDFHLGLIDLLSEYTLQNPNKPPVVLAGNLRGVQRDAAGAVVAAFTREQYFPSEPGARPMVEAFEVAAGPGRPAVGVVGVVGTTVAAKIEKLNPQFEFAPKDENGKPVTRKPIEDALAAMAKTPADPQLRVLLYVGGLEQAKLAAASFPQFNLVVCQSDEPEPPQFPVPENNGKTLVLQVGQKGQNAGVIGVFKAPGGGYELKYQLVPLGEEYLTANDPAAERANKVLALLEQYAGDVKKRDLLAAARQQPIPHAAQIKHPADKLTYVGAAVCAKCHAAEFAVWNASKHSQAYKVLEDAKRPALRQYDPECVVCHVTGWTQDSHGSIKSYAGGFENEKATPHLKGNQCENCHGPGSAHAAAPNDKAFYPELMAWTQGGGATRLPMPFIKAYGALSQLDQHGQKGNDLKKDMKLTADELRLVNTVSGMCMRCHDPENDPHFDFYGYFPKIYHSGLKAAGLPPGAK